MKKYLLFGLAIILIVLVGCENKKEGRYFDESGDVLGKCEIETYTKSTSDRYGTRTDYRTITKYFDLNGKYIGSCMSGSPIGATMLEVLEGCDTDELRNLGDTRRGGPASKYVCVIPMPE